MPARIDLNCDMGESFGAYKLGDDEAIIEYITSANIACGFHAGDPVWMSKTVQLAEQHGVAIGAHPSFPDLQGFGRRMMHLSRDEVTSDLIYQIGALQAFTRDKKLQHVKPHGALYNMATDGGEMARAICEAVLAVDPDMILVVLASSPWADIAEKMGLRVAREAFADRALNADGTLVPRSQAGSVINEVDEVVARSLQIVTRGTVTAITGEEIPIRADTLCIHGDTPDALSLAAAVRRALEEVSVEVVRMGHALRDI